MPHKATYLDKLESQPENDHDRLYHTVTGMCNRLFEAQKRCGKCCCECLEKCAELQEYIDFDKGDKNK